MIKIYTTVIGLLMTIAMQSQTYEFSISYVGINSNTGNYQMALMATPNSSVTNHSMDDMGAGFYVPPGVTLGNFVTGNSTLPASEWTSESLSNTFDAFFIYRVEAGAQTLFLNGTGPFELVLFDIIADPNPTSGEIVFVENGDPVYDELLYIENYINIWADNLYTNNNPTASSVSFSTLSNPEVFQNSSVSIFPNPASDVINIKTDMELTKVEVYDILGKRVLESVATNQLNVASFKAGVYFLKLHSSKGIMTRKVVIE